MANTANSRDVQRRSRLGTLAIAAGGISAVAFLALLFGVIAGVEGLEEGEDAVLGTVLWSFFTIGALIALVLGVAAFALGRAKHRPADRQAGLVGMGWFLVAVLLVVIINAFT